MNENPIDPFEEYPRFEAMQTDAEVAWLARLGQLLWGRTFAELQTRLTETRPEIPDNLDLADLRRLELSIERILISAPDPRWARMLPPAFSARAFICGAERLTAWEARREILRRIIERLEKR